jgi:hypothetical protein
MILGNHIPEFILFLLAGLASLAIAYILSVRRWDGVLQGLLIAQNLCIADAMLFHTVEIMGWVGTTVVNYAMVAPLFTIQVWIAYYLNTHVARDITTNAQIVADTAQAAAEIVSETAKDAACVVHAAAQAAADVVLATAEAKAARTGVKPASEELEGV